MGNAPPISRQQLRDLRQKYDKDDNGLSWDEFQALALEVGELQGLKKPVSPELLRKIFVGLDADGSGVVSIDEFEAAYAKLEEQLQAAAKAKAKGKAKPKAAPAKSKAAKPKAEPPKAKAPAKAAETTPTPPAPAARPSAAPASIFDALPGFDTFVPSVGGLLAEDPRVPKAKAIPTAKKTRAPPLPEPPPPPLSSQVPWSQQLKGKDPDYFDQDDPGFSSESDLAVGEVPDPAPVVEPAPARESKAAPAKAVESKAVPPKMAKPNMAKPKMAKPKMARPKSPAKAQAKPKVEAKGRAGGISANAGVTEDVFSSPIHRREAVAHPGDEPDPHALRVLQTNAGMDMIQVEPEVLSEPESQDSVESISGEIARAWDPTAKDVRYSYARDRAVGFSESWLPLKWSEEEWERRLIAAGSLKLKAAKHGTAPAKAPAPRAGAERVLPRPVEMPSTAPPAFDDLQGLAAQRALSAMRAQAYFDADELQHSLPSFGAQGLPSFGAEGVQLKASDLGAESQPRVAKAHQEAPGGNRTWL